MVKSNPRRIFAVAARADADFELLLPWYAVGALGGADVRGISSALASNAGLAANYGRVQRERAAVVEMAACAGSPSLRPLVALFAAIDADLANPAKVVAFRKAGTKPTRPTAKKTLVV